MGARPMLGHFWPILDVFSSKLPEIPNFWLSLLFVIILDAFIAFGSKTLSGGTTFNFWPILAHFHEHTLKMTLYHVTGLID